VVYDANNNFLWSSGTSGTNAERLDMEDDGRIIIYRSAWNSGTSTGQFIWSQLAHPSCDVGIGTGTTGVLGTGQCFVSPNGNFELLMQSDGNLVVYNLGVTPPAAIWSTNTVTAFSTGVGLTTLYTYDAVGNLTAVTQGSQTRSYTFDALGRMTQSVLPENGTTNFTYTDFGEVNTRTDARGVITTNGYDGLHRLSSVTYTVGTTGVPATPPLAFSYGTSTSSNNNGRLLKMTDGPGSETYTYDNMGRITQVSRVINGTTYNIGYAYNSAGDLSNLTYPSNRVVSPGYDAVGRMTQISSGGTNYLSGMTYNSAQLPTGFAYGNLVQASFGYNDHLQVASLSYTSGATTLLNLSYNYLDSNSHNNGQIQSIADSRGTAFSTTYTYDLLGRLQQAQTNDLTAANTWRLVWGYDRYGNRMSQSLTGGTMAVGQPQLTFDATTNHITTAGFSYDANGNLTHDTAGAYMFDADNRMTQSVVGSTTATYAYDGHRWRVQKTAGGTTTTYIYAGSKVIAEYVSGSLTKEYIYSGSKVLATIAGATVTYHHPDHLSNRLETNSSAATTRTFGQLPFGDSWYETGTADKWKFTSYERDTESGLDYAMHRYYSSGYGHFQTPDLLMGSIANPQSLNRYAYVTNDPANMADPLGLLMVNVPGNPGAGGIGGSIGDPWDAHWNCELFRIMCPDPGLGPVGDGRGGTGGGGGGGANKDKDIKPWDPGLRKMIWDLLMGTNDCASWLDNGDKGSAAELMRVVPITLANENEEQPLSNPADATTTANPKGSIDVDRWGRFYSDSGNGLLIGDRYSAGSIGARMVILLHELGHKLNPKGFQVDVGPGPLYMPDKPKSDANTQLVIDHCAGAIDGKSK
jgi:RHS repeat-associated protein